jgi:hypothetical protein
MRSPIAHALGAALALMLIAAAAVAAPKAWPPDRTFSTGALARGFMLTVFGREGPVADDGRQYVNKFVDPVSVSILNFSRTVNRVPRVRQFVGLLDRIVPGLRIGMAKSAAKARLRVYLVDRRDFRGLIAETLAEGSKTTYLEGTRCATMMWTRTPGVLDHASIFVVVDEGDTTFEGCLAEELTQALGPANDSAELPYSLYNDYNDVNSFGLFDWYILSMVYDEAILAGMTPEEANAHLPAIIARLRLKAVAADNEMRAYNAAGG